MRRNWPDEFATLLENAEEVTLTPPGSDTRSARKALKLRLAEQDYEKIWPLAETRFRLQGNRTGSAITLIANNPHYQQWHPVDGGTEQETGPSGRLHETKFVVVHFLLDDVREPVDA